MNADHTIKTLVNHVAELLELHSSDIARSIVLELSLSLRRPVVKPPQRIGQCIDLEALYAEGTSDYLKLLAETHHAVHWADAGGADKPVALQRRLAFAELIGPTGMIFNERSRVGLFFQRAQTTYPLHKHAAEELYLVLSGKALWQRGADDELWQAAGTFIHHESWESHAMRTTTEPMLAIWCWMGNVQYEQYLLSQT